MIFYNPNAAAAIPLNVFEVVIRNAGKTPAQINEIALKYITVDKMEDLPAIPDYGRPESVGELPLASDEGIGKRAPLTPRPSLTDSEARAIENAQRFVYAYGIVRYKDVFGKGRETRWGFVYDFPQGLNVSIMQPSFQRAGPPAYNKAT